MTHWTDWTPEQLIDYCESHSRTERALFVGAMINRLIELAGSPPHYYLQHKDEWISVRWEEDINDLVRWARERRAHLHRADRLLSTDELREKYVTEHPQFGKCDWRWEVNEDATLLGYWPWVMYKLEEEP